ncbi:(2Fe-2S) ferredoxin domain-containing protein [Paenibacillus rhizophilus]|uniref:(2Fe-2S) ferredoxin domain-containing protein n=1 Tax=Paenibacillus rhizophilus TaxID=1850366 RepID=A0A3N9PA25_9BACL|nr:(2Fe-2S) ferredoxin domain-containing protein [Paenibacillus rhizophilus]RQW11894.1 (2Fe-2S) ferredoxin domain-containing protein [Paenibacillus rhizophilus]
MNMRLKVLKKHLLFCCSEHCNNQDVEDVMQAFKEELVEQGINKTVKINKTSCLGLCGNGPFLIVYPDGVWYYNVTTDDVQRIVKEHLVEGNPVDELVMLKMEA